MRRASERRSERLGLRHGTHAPRVQRALAHNAPCGDGCALNRQRTDGSVCVRYCTLMTDTSGALSGVRPIGPALPSPLRSVVNVWPAANGAAASARAAAARKRFMARGALGTTMTFPTKPVQLAFVRGRRSLDSLVGWRLRRVCVWLHASAGAGAAAAAAASAAAAAARSRKKPCRRRCASPKEPLTCTHACVRERMHDACHGRSHGAPSPGSVRSMQAVWSPRRLRARK